MTLDEILNDPTIDAVTVETEEKYLTKYAYLAALKNKHIHMEKPGGTNLDEFEKLTNTIKDKGIVFHICYMYRYQLKYSNHIHTITLLCQIQVVYLSFFSITSFIHNNDIINDTTNRDIGVADTLFIK